MTAARHALLRAGLLLGIGLGGFVDGIVLHQLLQWHQMLSARIPPVDLVSAKVNMVWDGVFHAVVWSVTLLGVVQLWRCCTRHAVAGQGRALAGAMLLGWAAFNLVEGVLNHHVFGLHHVREFVLRKAIWDWGFLAVSVGIALLGAWLLRRTPATKLQPADDAGPDVAPSDAPTATPPDRRPSAPR